MNGLACILFLLAFCCLSFIMPQALRNMLDAAATEIAPTIEWLREWLLRQHVALLRVARDLVETDSSASPEAGASPRAMVKSAVRIAEYVIGALFFSATALVGATAEACLLFLTFTAMLNIETPGIPPLYQIGVIVVSAINNVVFWGAVRMDLIGWTHLADWSLPIPAPSRDLSGSAQRANASAPWARIWESIGRGAQSIAVWISTALEPRRAFRWFTTGMVALLLAMFVFAALYRDQLLALAGMASSTADATPIKASLDWLRKFSLLIAAVSTFMTVLIAGVFPFRLARYLGALMLAWSAVLLLLVVALIVGAQTSARAMHHMAHAWLDALQQAAEHRRGGSRANHPDDVEQDSTSDDIGTESAAVSGSPSSRWVRRRRAPNTGRIRARRTQQR